MPVHTKHRSLSEHLKKVELTEAAFTGNVKHLVPALTGQTGAEYTAYVERASYYNNVEKAVLALIGTLTRKAPVVEGLVDEEPNTDHISFNNFLATCFKSLLLQSRVGILVDWDDAAQTSKLIAYPSSQIINWAVGMYVVSEGYIEQDPSDMFSQKCGTQYRVLFLNADGQYQVDLYRAEEGNEQSAKLYQSTIPTVRGAPLNEVPFFISTPYDCSEELYTPPLYSLADLNINHFKMSVDLAHVVHLAALPLFWMAGRVATEDGSQPHSISLGTTGLLVLEHGGQANKLELSGEGAVRIADYIKTLEHNMAQLAARLLTPGAGVESAEALSIRSGSETALLETLATSLEGALTDALRVYNAWHSSSVEPEITLNRSFTNSTIDPSHIQTLLKLHTDGVLSLETLLERLTELEVIDDAMTELDRIEAEEEILKKEMESRQALFQQQPQVNNAVMPPGAVEE